MELPIFPANRKEVQETWKNSLMGNNPFSQHRVMLVLGNLFCMICFANLAKYAFLRNADVSKIMISMTAALIFQVFGGYYAFLLFRSMQKLLKSEGFDVAPQDFLRISYIGYRLYLTLLLGLGAVAMLVPAYLKL